MPLDRIKAMPVADLCEDNAHLYLWCPNGLLPEALEVVKAWGFTFRSPISPGSGWEITSEMPARYVFLPLVVKNPRSSSAPSQIGSLLPSRNIATNQRSNLRLLSGCRTVLIWKCSLAAVDRDGTAGALRLPAGAISSSLATPPRYIRKNYQN